MLTFAASERVVCVRLAEPTTILHISIHDIFVSNAGHLSPALLAELERLEPGGSARLWQRAAERALALALAEQIGASVDARAVQTLSEDFRRRYGLMNAEQTRAWLESQHLDLASFSALRGPPSAGLARAGGKPSISVCANLQ